MSEEKRIFYKTLNNIVATNRIDNEEAYILNNYISYLERLNNIIKEVREYMKSIEHEPDADMYIELGQYKEYKHILEILDKVEEK